jgi:hypothetical protein
MPWGNAEQVPDRLLAWLVWWIASWWAFQLLAGDWNRIEWIAGACVATVAATLAELMRTLAGLELKLRGERLLRLPSALLQVPVDFWRLVVALPRRTPGTYVARAPDPNAVGAEGETIVIAGFSPNAYVVDLEPDAVLLHDLVPARDSERPA